jgi:hypothetical protein
MGGSCEKPRRDHRPRHGLRIALPCHCHFGTRCHIATIATGTGGLVVEWLQACVKVDARAFTSAWWIRSEIDFFTMSAACHGLAVSRREAVTIF